MKDITIEKCQEYNPLDPRSNRLGFCTFYRAYDSKTNKYFMAKTKKELLEQIKLHRR